MCFIVVELLYRMTQILVIASGGIHVPSLRTMNLISNDMANAQILFTFIFMFLFYRIRASDHYYGWGLVRCNNYHNLRAAWRYLHINIYTFTYIYINHNVDVDDYNDNNIDAYDDDDGDHYEDDDDDDDDAAADTAAAAATAAADDDHDNDDDDDDALIGRHINLFERQDSGNKKA